MTICIAALCDEGRACVVGADREITVGLPLNVGFEHHEKKIDPLTANSVVMSAGNALIAAEVVSRARRTLAGAASDTEIQQAGAVLRDVYMAIHMERAAQVILAPRGLTVQEFKEAGAQRLPPQIYQAIDNLFWNFTLQTEFILSGVDAMGGHIGWVHYHGLQGAGWLEWFDKLGYQAIGSGSSHAGVLLALSGQHKGLTAAQTVYNVFSAKLSAEVAPGVGSSTDVAIIKTGALTFLTEDALAKLKKLRAEVLGQRPEAIEKDVEKLLKGTTEE